MMRSMLPAMAVGLFATAAAAETGTLQVGTGHICPFEKPDATNSYTVRLQQGRDYALEAAGEESATASFQLKAAGGKILGTAASCGDDCTAGSTFRAPYTGTYSVLMQGSPNGSPEHFEPAECWVAVDIDCRANKLTQCTLPVGSTRDNRLFNYWGDVDWFRTSLQRGKRYAAQLVIQADDPGTIVIRDADRKVAATADSAERIVDGRRIQVATITGFRPTATATYFAEVRMQFSPLQHRYSVRLTTP